ncbi:MAG TPA: hypothetical protein VKX96_05570, partial [Chloroflexota bacterium]|nr:hypothetical protein [Chloroflexota bacterium]
MSAPRVSRGSFSVARLLADEPNERLTALAKAWAIDFSDGPIRIAALYRRMTDPRLRDERIAQLSSPTRLIFANLVQASSPRAPDEIGRALPFSDEEIDRSLKDLEAIGLAWRARAVGRQRLPGDGRWFVPLELCDSAPNRRSSGREQASRAEKFTAVQPPIPRVLEAPPPLVRPSGQVPTFISALLDSVDVPAELRPETPAEVLTYAQRVGTALGVLRRRGARVLDGPRADAWRSAGPADRVRALARLWLVDRDLRPDTSQWVRRNLWNVLGTLDRSVWYDLSSVARRMAWQLNAEGTNGVDLVAERTGSSSHRSITRRDVEGAVEVLGWIGVLVVGESAQGRPTAIKVGDEGAS